MSAHLAFVAAIRSGIVSERLARGRILHGEGAVGILLHVFVPIDAVLAQWVFWLFRFVRRRGRLLFFLFLGFGWQTVGWCVGRGLRTSASAERTTSTAKDTSDAGASSRGDAAANQHTANGADDVDDSGGDGACLVARFLDILFQHFGQVVHLVDEFYAVFFGEFLHVAVEQHFVNLELHIVCVFRFAMSQFLVIIDL